MCDLITPGCSAMKCASLFFRRGTRFGASSSAVPRPGSSASACSRLAPAQLCAHSWFFMAGARASLVDELSGRTAGMLCAEKTAPVEKISRMDGIAPQPNHLGAGMEGAVRRMKTTFAVAQLGARMHYAVPRIFHSAGLLDRLFTDICAQKGWPRLLGLVPAAMQPAGLRPLSGRVVEGVPSSLVTAFNLFGLEYSRRRARAQNPTDSTKVYLWGGKRFCELIIKTGLGGAGGVYVFNSAGLELL